MRSHERCCEYCGQKLGIVEAYPVLCGACGRKNYRNPIPVAVALIPVRDCDGLLAIRRAIEPGKGDLALPGGFVDWVDISWQHAAAREVREEVGLELSHESFQPFDVISSAEKRILIFGICAGIASLEVGKFQRTNETSELVIITEPCELAFPLHTQVVHKYFSRDDSAKLPR